MSRPRLFPPAYFADLHGGVDPAARFDVELRCVAEVTLRRRKAVLALAEAVYRVRQRHQESRPAQVPWFRYSDNQRYTDGCAWRRIDTLHAQIHRLTALSKEGILAL